jgi:hypothetical protein
MNKRREAANAGINLVWTGLLLTPVYIFCARYVSVKWLVLFGLVSVLPLGVPRAVLQQFGLSADVSVYRHLRVPLIVRFTQDAPWLRRVAGHPSRRVSLEGAVIARVVRDSWMRERFHFALLLFCGFCSVLALWQKQFSWCVALTFINIVYNLYPVWLQQYLRLRLSPVLRRSARAEGK